MSVNAKIAAIELGEDGVRLALVKTGGRRPKVLELHACAVTRPDVAAVEATSEVSEAETVREAQFDALVKATQQVVKRLRGRPSAYVLCAPSSRSVVRSLTIPFRGKRRVAAAVRFELEPYLAFPIEELVIDHIPVVEAEGATEVLTVGMREDYLSEQMAVLAAAGVDVEGVGIDGVGLTALWQAVQGRTKGLSAVVHVRQHGAIFAMVYGKNLAYFRHLGVSAADVRENPMALARQVQNSIRAFLAGWHGAPEISGVAVTGIELFAEERALLEDELHLPVRAADVFGGLNGAARCHRAALREAEKWAETMGTEAPEWQAQVGAGEHSNFWAGVVGVAMTAAGGTFSLNLRRGDLAWSGASKVVVGHVLFSSCLALLALVGVAWHFHEEYKNNLDQVDVLKARVAEVSANIDAIRASGLDVPPDFFSDPSLLDVLLELSDKMPDSKVRITNLKIGRFGLPSGEWITVSGESKNKGQFDEVVAALKASPTFLLDEDPDYRMEGGQSTFTIKIKRPDAEAQAQAEGN